MSAALPENEPESTCFETLRAGRFRIRNCGACGNHLFYPSARSGSVICMNPNMDPN